MHFSIIDMLFFLPGGTLSSALSALWWTACTCKLMKGTSFKGNAMTHFEQFYFTFFFPAVDVNSKIHEYLHALQSYQIYPQHKY